MSIYDIDWSKAGPRLMPPDKRNKFILKYLAALLKPVQWITDLWMHDYRVGSSAIPYISSTTYAKYDRVKQNTIIYESLIDNNNDDPNVTASWMVVQKNFIGVSERILYTGQTLTLTDALNKRFVTTFRQPPNLSDIWIDNNTLSAYPFIVGSNDTDSSTVFSSTSSDFVIDGYSFTARYNFNINMPAAVYLALDPIPANCDKIVRAFVDSYIPAGLTYTIITY